MDRVDRGRLGTMHLATERDDDSYLDFVEGVRSFTTAKLSQTVVQRGKAALADYAAETGHQATTIAEAREALDSVPVIATRNRLMRSTQEMMWRKVAETYHQRKDELLAELDRFDTLGPGTVQWDPNFVYPEYFSTVDFHIQPGGYHGYPLTGLIYHYGTKVFFTGRNNNDDVQRELAYITPVPPDGQVRRILDSACGIGQATTA
ncbi:MAG: hypothetical protein NZ518_02950, partial [Dehalococcoidia bacterium]|nr:hypothetical protein [Dehalococcoidia bacterium]